MIIYMAIKQHNQPLFNYYAVKIKRTLLHYTRPQTTQKLLTMEQQVEFKQQSFWSYISKLQTKLSAASCISAESELTEPQAGKQQRSLHTKVVQIRSYAPTAVTLQNVALSQLHIVKTSPQISLVA
jgi:hypothetical protein